MSAINRTTLSLFNEFPREVANPDRKTVYKLKKFKEFIHINDTINDCFTSLYSHKFNLDKAVFDFDRGDSLLVAKTLYTNWCDAGLSVIPTFSGDKGFHLYVRMEELSGLPEIDLKYKLSQTQYGLLKMVVNTLPREVDTSVIGDIRQLIRIPNTSRPPKNEKFCTYLPEWFSEMDYEDVVEYSQRPNDIVYFKGKAANFDEFSHINPINVYKEKRELRKYEHSKNLRKTTYTVPFYEGSVVASEDVRNFFKPILRPCLYARIIRENPNHLTRLAAAVDLQQSMKDHSITKYFSKIGWYDFDPSYTYYQLEQAREKNYLPYSCSKLREKGIPESCCNYGESAFFKVKNNKKNNDP